jgi:conjugal transfer/entry exclusion protein
MRLQANFKKTSSKEHANAPIDHNASLLEEQLKVYKAKWHSTQLKLKNLQSKQTELKSYLTAELKKWKEAIKATSLSIQSSFAKREEAVRSAREQVKQYRDKENKWNK